MNYSNLYSLIGLKEEINRLRKQVNLGWEKEFRTLKWLGLNDGMKILDLGGGPGFFSELLLENLPNCKVTILEPDKGFMKFAKENLSKYEDRVEFKEESIYENSIAKETYDFVVSRFVFQHLEDPISASKEIYRVLKYGGIVSVIDSDKEIWGISEPDILKGERNIL
ncbi:MAG: class I SAM-dependent methyltransferase, partial [Peptostreptococcaceae bacterium]